MCKTWSIGYTCKHYYTTRLSTCHGTFTVQPKPGKPHKPACCSAPVFVVKSSQACGDCQRNNAEQYMQTLVAAARSTAGTSALQLSEIELEYQSQCFKLQKTFPGCRRYQGSAKPGKGLARPTDRNRGSLLKREIMAEDVVERYEEHRTVIGGTWDQSTWGDYTSLGDELAEKDDEDTPSMDLPMTGLMAESMEDYCDAFEQTGESENDQHEQSEEHEGNDASWSAPWSSEREESQAWTSEETTYWSSQSELEGDEATCWSSESRQNGKEEDATLVATPSPSMPLEKENESTKMLRIDDTIAQKPTYIPSGKENKIDQTFKMKHTDGAHTTLVAARPPSVTARTLPTRGKRPDVHRRSTFDGGKMEMELRDRFQCLRLAYFISVGGD